MTLDQWIKDNGSSNTKLARAVGVSPPFISRIRSGERQPSLPVAVKLAEATKLPVECFLNGGAS